MMARGTKWCLRGRTGEVRSEKDSSKNKIHRQYRATSVEKGGVLKHQSGVGGGLTRAKRKPKGC